MKTSVVLLALATAALAAPALHEEAFEDEHHVPVDFLDTVTRERKSTHDAGASPSSGALVNLPSSQIAEFGVSGRSFNLKKPIIIKKRVGTSYQVYRDSDEEKLDSPEKCRKQVKVKLCDHTEAEAGDMMKSSTIEDANLLMNEDDMKHSIKLAKEAVENIQKDLRKVESKSGQPTSWKHGESESEVELHKDIEVARQALEHIHNKFEILETPSVHDMTLKEAEVLEDVMTPLAQNTEERLVQWKEALVNIQRNVEIVRNIEDSFKSTDDDEHHADDAVTSTKGINEKESHKFFPKEDMRLTENFETKAEHKPIVENLTKHEKSSEHDDMKMEHDGKDMLESASTVSASKIQELNQNDKARLMSELKNEHFTKAKDSFDTLSDVEHTIKTESIHDLPQNMKTMSIKTVEEEKENEPATFEKKHMGKIDKLDKEPSMIKMKSIDSTKLLELQRNAAEELHGSSTQLAHKREEQAESIAKEAMEDKNTMKSIGNIADKNSELMKGEDQHHEEKHTMAQLKEASLMQPEKDELTKDTSLLAEMKTQGDMMQKEHTLTEGKKAFNGNPMIPALTTNLDQHKVMDPTFEMKAVEDTNDMQQQLIDRPHMRWSSDKNFNSEMGLMKSAAEVHQSQMNKMHSGHHHVHQHARPHHLDTSSHAKLHDHFMTHGKSADMDNAMQSNYFMNMRESDIGQEGHGFRWRPSHQHMHESARTAYGASAASAPASGAVGLFPNANVGGCGIPLLLSCNPSVVSGSLAKAHPASYSAPAYRTEEDFNFHAKRDVKKTDTLNRTNQHLKTSSIFLTKQ